MGDITKNLNSPFLQNKFVLYGSLLIVLLAILCFLANHNFNAIVLMALIGLLTSFFSKNMIIVLLTPFFAVVVLELIRGDMMIEGLENKAKAKDTDTDKAKDTDKANAKDKDINAKWDNVHTPCSTATKGCPQCCEGLGKVHLGGHNK